MLIIKILLNQVKIWNGPSLRSGLASWRPYVVVITPALRNLLMHIGHYSPKWGGLKG